MSDKLNKFTQNFLSKFISNSANKVEADSKIEGNNGYTVENTDHTSNNLLSLLNANSKPVEALVLPKSNIMNHLEKKMIRKQNLKLKTTNASTNISREKIKSIMTKNSFSPKVSVKQTHKGNVNSVNLNNNFNTNHNTKISNENLNFMKESSQKLQKEESEEKIVLKCSSKLTFSPNSTAKKFKVIQSTSQNSMNQKMNNQNVFQKKKSNPIDYTKNVVIAPKSKKHSQEEISQKKVNMSNPNKTANPNNIVTKNSKREIYKLDPLLESRKQFNKNFSKMKAKLSTNESSSQNNQINSNVIKPQSSNASFPIEDQNKRPYSENKKKIKSPTKISLFNPSKGKLKGKNTTNTTYFSSSPNKNKEVLSSGQNSMVLSSGQTSKRNLYSEVISHDSPKHEVPTLLDATNKNFIMNFNYNNYYGTEKEELNFSEDEKKSQKKATSSGFLSQENEPVLTSQSNRQPGFIKNKYRLLLDNYNKSNVTSNPV